jgi:hypothetical protein
VFFDNKYCMNCALQLSQRTLLFLNWINDGLFIFMMPYHHAGCNIWTTRASVSPGYPNTRKMYENTSAKRECFHTLFKFRVLWYPGETRARVVYMASQMNRDVTECFRLLIWIEFLTKHNVIRNSIQVILRA